MGAEGVEPMRGVELVEKRPSFRGSLQSVQNSITGCITGELYHSLSFLFLPFRKAHTTEKDCKSPPDRILMVLL